VTPRGAQISYMLYEVFHKDLTIIGSFAVNRTFEASIAMIEGGMVKVEPLISHVLPIEDFAKGFELAQTDPKREH
jgi:D-arabinitol dehydrogenase (NADP+)